MVKDKLTGKTVQEEPLELTADLIVEAETGQNSEVEIDNHLAKTDNHNDLKAIQAFLSEGADINMKNERGWTALHEAAKDGHINAVKFLIEKGADLNIANERGWTALHRAANSGHLEVVKLLIKRNANVNCKDSDGLTALSFALRNSYLEIAKLLIERGANVNCFVDNRGMTVFSYALKHMYFEIAGLLVKNGAGPDTADVGYPVLLFALKNDQIELAKILIEKGAKINCKDAKGQTVLHYASKSNDKALVELLVKKGVNVVAVDSDGFMPIHKSTSAEIISFLKKKMLPVKTAYSFLLFILTFFFSSTVVPLIFAFIMAGFTFFAAMVLVPWPVKSARRLYLLEILTACILLLNLIGFHVEKFEYFLYYLTISAFMFFVLNLVIPSVLYLQERKDGIEQQFTEFIKKYLKNDVSFSPFTMLKKWNLVIMAVVFSISFFLNFDRLKNNDLYLWNGVIKTFINPSVQQKGIQAAKVYSSVNNLPQTEYELKKSGQKDFDMAINQYLSKNFNGAVSSLNKAVSDRSITDKASEVKIQILRFRKLWEEVKKPKKSIGLSRDAMIDLMIQYDKNISGGKLESEILLLKHGSPE